VGEGGGLSEYRHQTDGHIVEQVDFHVAQGTAYDPGLEADCTRYGFRIGIDGEINIVGEHIILFLVLCLHALGQKDPAIFEHVRFLFLDRIQHIRRQGRPLGRGR